MINKKINYFVTMFAFLLSGIFTNTLFAENTGMVELNPGKMKVKVTSFTYEIMYCKQSGVGYLQSPNDPDKWRIDVGFQIVDEEDNPLQGVYCKNVKLTRQGLNWDTTVPIKTWTGSQTTNANGIIYFVLEDDKFPNDVIQYFATLEADLCTVTKSGYLFDTDQGQPSADKRIYP